MENFILDIIIINCSCGNKLVARKLGINSRLNKVIDSSLVDNESDLNFDAGQNVH